MILFGLVCVLVCMVSMAGYGQTSKPFLNLPIDCDLGEDCWFMNYVDVDPDTGVARDFTCDKRSYEGHKGTDIAIRSTHEMEKGVDVRAAASGKILRFRDGEDDAFKTAKEMDAVRDARKECGNGVIIDHGEGWITQYCHLKKGSISVKEGDEVRARQPIAQVGMSGITEHPHIHMSVLYKGNHIDPFTNLDKESGCDVGTGGSLWRNSDVKYESFALYDAGFVAERPQFSEISKGNRGARPDKNSDAMIFWGAYFGAKQGDTITMVIRDPNDKHLVEKTMVQDAVKARQYYFIGKKRASSEWRKGTYRADISVMRDGMPVQAIKKALDIY